MNHNAADPLIYDKLPLWLARAMILAVIVCLPSAVDAAAPQITGLPIRGLQIGNTTILTIQGRDLLPNPKVVLGVPIAKQELLAKSTATSIKLRVTLAANITPGLYNLRIANGKGITTAIPIAIDGLSQIAMTEKTAGFPVALHGSLTGSTITKTTIQGKAGEPLLAEVEAQRLGGKLRPVLHLYDSRHRQVAWSMSVPWLGGDTRLVTSFPADGVYTLELHDQQYAGPNPGHFRLKIGQFQYADLAFPPAIQRGKTTAVQLIGNLPPNARVNITATSQSVMTAPWHSVATSSGWRPRILISDIPEFVESESSATSKDVQKLSGAPCAISGRIDAPKQEDVYRIEVATGTKMRFEVFAGRIGSPLDSYLELRNEKGGRLAQNDDISGTSDSRIDYTVPKNVTAIDIVIRNQVRRGDRHCLYRVVITRIGEKPLRPSFRLTAALDAHNVPQGATHVLPIFVSRNGYDGPIRLSVDALPPGVTASTVDIPAGVNGGLVTLKGSTNAPSGVVTSIRGTSVGIEPPITAIAKFEKHALAKIQPWLQNQIGVALAPANAIPFVVDWSKPLAESPLFLGTTFKATIRLNRPPGAFGPVRLSLVQGSPTPLIKGKPDVNRVTRAERATVDIPVDKKAKAAFDALNVATKAVSAAQAKVKTALATGAKNVTTAQTALKVANDKKLNAQTIVADAGTERKTLETSRNAANETRTAAETTLKGANANDKAAAEMKLKEATATLAGIEQSLVQSTAKLDAATKELGIAMKAFTDTETKAKSALDTAAKANAAAKTLTKTAEDKHVKSKKALAAAEAQIKKDVEFNVIVPPNLKVIAGDLALKAELRSIDNKTVLAQVYTPVRRFVPQNPLGVKLTGGHKFESKLDAKSGATITLVGAIDRKAGFAGDVTVTISGQPKGVAAPKIVVKPKTKDFKLEIKFPANFKPAMVKTIKLVASGPFDPKKKNIVVRFEQAIEVNILAAAPPEKKK